MNGMLISRQEDAFFGLAVADLTDAQLDKIHFNKLIDMMGLDARLPKIIADKLATTPLERMTMLCYKHQQFIKDTYFVQKYNEFYRSRAQEIHKNWHKGSIIFWNLLDDVNRANEVELFKNKTGISIVGEQEYDYNWCWKYDPETSRKIARKALTSAYFQSLKHFVQLAPRELYLEFLPTVLRKAKTKKYGMGVLLLNENTPERNIIQALRSLSKVQQTVDSIKVKITRDLLQKIPPVMRLNALEKILVHKENYQALEDIKQPEDLEKLIFGTTIKYPQRVEQLLKLYKRNTEQK